MVYTEYSKLSIIRLSKQKDFLSFKECKEILWERPANTLYVEVNDLLYGIITMGDISRAQFQGKDYVEINKKFISVQRTQYMRARQIIKDMQGVNAIPIVDEYGHLEGAYSRWDDTVYLKYSAFWNNPNPRCFSDTDLILGLVCPSSIYKRKMVYLEESYQALEKIGFKVHVVDKSQILEYLDIVDKLCFVDEEELRGVKGYYRNILGEQCGRSWYKATTIKKFYKERMDNQIANAIIQNVKKKGIPVLTIGVQENENGYLENFYRKLRMKYEQKGIKPSNALPNSMKEDFYGGIYNDTYKDQIMPIPNYVTKENGIYKMSDMDTKLFHVVDGERATVGQPEKYDGCIYIFGPCVIVGVYVEDRYTIASWLQSELNQAGFLYKVKNMGVVSHDVLGAFYKIADASFRKNDIIIVDDSRGCLDVEYDVNLVDVLEENNVPETWCVNDPRHCNHTVNHLYAKGIYNKLLPMLTSETKEKCEIESNNKFIVKSYINKYFKEYLPIPYKKVGSIVMNCNPFTYGHRYLIEKALGVVEFLFIFVVEEDRSLFSFDERYAMVRQGVSDLDNVLVVPSGDFILSATNFPEYFVKQLDKDIVKNVENDITIFAEKIAPELKITHRFVGEELEDRVTYQYNEAMKRILPKHGIELIEIPRKTSGDRRISATYVRRCLEQNLRDEITKFIPESTQKIIFEESE